MNRGDDEALNWVGDDDPTLAAGWKPVGPKVPLEGGTEGEPADSAAGGEGAPNVDGLAGASGAAIVARQLTSVELVVFGLLGGVYLLYTIGWALVALKTPPLDAGMLNNFMYSVGLWLAVAAVPLWFGCAMWLTRRPVRRIVSLAIGAIMLIPFPFLFGLAK
ncbi:MAG TPA: hypothetical protein VFU07_07435 [Candidatus Lumbricidophila sp.]|nr:hypothetical protein [Candidatus Lumbricidophila sp.]